MASFDSCVSQRRNIGQIVRALDSFVIGHVASMAVLHDGQEFLTKLEGLKRKQLKALLATIFGTQAVRKLDDDQLAILGLQAFKY